MSKSLSARQCDFTHALALLIMHAAQLKYDVKIQELNRELETQRRYVAEGKSHTMNSKHLDKLAADLVLFRDGEVQSPEAYEALAQYWVTLGGVWGGSWQSFKDFPHFEWVKDA